MRLSQISLGNLRRRKGKAVLLSAGLTIGIAMVVALTSITSLMKADVERKLDEYGANIIVTPKSERLSLSYGGVEVTDASLGDEELRAEDASLIMQIHSSRNISAVAPKLLGAASVGGRTVLVSGVDFPSEFRIKKWWKVEGVSPFDHRSLIKSPSDVIIGSAAAKDLNVRMGDTITLPSASGAPEAYTVKGVLEENASQDDLSVFMDISSAQRLLAKEGKVSLIEVSALCSECPISDIVAQISAKLPHAKVSAVRQAMDLRMRTVEQFIRFSIAVSVVVVAIGALMVFVSMMSSVNERTREIGIFRAIGFRKSHIVKVILIEAFIVSLISGISGWLIGSISAAVIYPSGSGPFFDPLMFGLSGALALLVGLLSSIYPAIRASRLEPIEALRYV